MALSQEETIDVLNGLLEFCYDGKEGFLTAASNAERSDVILAFQARAQRFDEAAAELYTAIRHLGGHPVEHGHAEARLHRGWIHLRALTAKKGDDAVIAEVERGENEARRRYRHAAGLALRPDLHDLVVDQLQAVEENLARVRMLRGVVNSTEKG
jgi:uncharacterized protein (TIGR02284 family)